MVLLVALALTLAVTPLAARVARAVGIVDRPGALKLQSHPVPYLGGAAVFAGTAISGFAGPTRYLVPIGLALALGLADDIRALAPRIRLLAQVGIGVVGATIVDTRLPDPMGGIAVVVAVVALINAVNLIDGLDGLAGGVALAASFGFAALLSDDGRVLALALAGSLLAFLAFNRPPARIYLGDGGAYLLGAALAVLLALAWADGRSTSTGVASLLLVAVPAADLAVTIVRRAIAGRPLFEGDRSHIYDQLVDRGWSTAGAAGALVGAQAVLTVVAVGASRGTTVTAVLLVLVAVGLGCAVVGDGRFVQPASLGGADDPR